MILRKLSMLGVLTTLAFSSSCSSGDSGNDTTACVPGQSVQCAGISGCIGAQSCKSDGSGYDTCVCGGQNGSQVGGTSSYSSNAQSTGGRVNGIGTGGSKATFNTGGNTGITVNATGGMPSTSAGGTPSTSTGGTSSSSTAATTCSPKSMTGYTYPSYVPARHIANSCTEQAITQYFTDCYTNGNCTAFQTGGAQAQCGACLSPTDLTASAYGPLLKVGPASTYYLETNVAGCEELMGETACAPKMQVEFLCEYYACLDSCASATYDATFACMDAARAGQCAQLQAATVCLTIPASVTACSGSSFQAQFINIAKVFCL